MQFIACSEATAVRFAVPQRGSIRDGLVADLVVLDPDSVSDRSTYDEPWLPPAGIHHVILGGQFSVWNGEVVDGRAGVVLQRAASNRGSSLETTAGAPVRSLV